MLHYSATSLLCCIALSLRRKQQGGMTVISKDIQMKGVFHSKNICSVSDPWGINRKCLQTCFLQVYLHKDNCELVVNVLYLYLDLISELPQIPHQLACIMVSGSEHHLQSCTASRSSSHDHAEVMLWLELHVSLKEMDTIITMTQIAAVNQIKKQQQKKLGQGRGWWGTDTQRGRFFFCPWSYCNTGTKQFEMMWKRIWLNKRTKEKRFNDR